MVDKIPVRLKKEPLIEAIWEIRFSPAKPLVADLLPGILFESSPKKFDNVVKLSFPNLPDFAMEHDPNLRYIPRIRLEGGQFIRSGRKSCFVFKLPSSILWLV